MNEELKIIKKKYGEKMARLCREFFPTLLETEGLLSNLMLKHFEPNHDLYDDIIKQEKENDFKNYIFSLVDVEDKKETKIIKTPEELLSEAGYDLYECKCEEDIQKFKKYYAKGEELCTFHGGRLNRCYVFFAVKKDVSDIKREDFPKPKRQDEYGTSVISIQFTRDKSHTLSIKNRYNHIVNNPDSTFGNNLDNIIRGLTESFGKYYGLVQKHLNNKFELGGYVRANDGKYYKYNYEFYNIYYCPNNIIIDNFKVKRYDKEKYIIFDYFILDLVKKEIRFYNSYTEDSFPSTIPNIEKIEIERKEDDTKEIKITLLDNRKVTIVLNKFNNIIELDNPYVKDVGNNFLCYVKHLEVLKMANLQTVKNFFLYNNKVLKEVYLPSLEKVGNYFCLIGQFKELSLNSLQEVGDCFTLFNASLEEINLPLLEKVGDDFMYCNNSIKKISTPNLQKVGHSFFLDNSYARKSCLLQIKKNDLKKFLNYLKFRNGNKQNKKSR